MTTIIYHKNTVYNLDICKKIYLKNNYIVIQYPNHSPISDRNKQFLGFESAKEAEQFFNEFVFGMQGKNDA